MNRLKTILLITSIIVGVILFSEFNLITSGNGFFEFIMRPIFFVILIVITIAGSVLHTGKYWEPKSFLIQSIIGFVALISLWLLNKQNMTQLDWVINQSNRKTIVELVKQGELKNGIIPDSLSLNFTCNPKSFEIDYQNDTLITVTFYTDLGLLDHYSCFKYSNFPQDLKELQDEIQNGGNDYSIDNNWFLINN